MHNLGFETTLLGTAVAWGMEWYDFETAGRFG